MKNKIKRALAAVMVAGMCLAASSCQLSEMLGKDTTAETTTGTIAETTTASSGNEALQAEAMDFSTIDVLQYVTPGKYRGIDVMLEVKQVSDDDYNSEIKNILDNNGTYTQIKDRVSADGDTLNIDFKGFMDGVQFQGGTADDRTIELTEQNGYIDGFMQGLVGIMPGTTVILDLTFPENYHVEEYAGKPVTFEVTVNYIHGEYIDAELNDEFVVRYTGGELKTVAELEEYVRKKLASDNEAEAKETAVSAMWTEIMDGAEVISYPQQQLDYYYAMQINQCEYYAQMYGMTVETIMQVMGYSEESFRENAEKYTKEDLVFFAIAQIENIMVSEDEYVEGLAGDAAEAGVSSEQLEDYYGKQYINECLLWDKLLGQLFEWANVVNN